MLLAPAGGSRVPVIAQLVQADEDTVRDVIHAFNEKGLACLGPRWVGGRPRQLKSDDEDFIIQTATTRPVKLGRPSPRTARRSWTGSRTSWTASRTGWLMADPPPGGSVRQSRAL
ncbi:helix-turn-helix domain-containing protein [Streptomyces lincolnensis]|uniref:helix-turn-helix domain-containing protein n=1 Tax=Streptomyces lincolnensis TaxID=1915 RepID=UPI0037CCE542